MGIGTTDPRHKLHVQGNLFADGTLMASNLVILGDYVQLDTVTSNTEQMVIRNTGSGPGLKVTQTGVEDVAAFYDDDSLAMVVADGGNVGIGITLPLGRLHVAGPSSAIMGNLGVGIVQPIAGARLHVNGTTVVEGSILPGTCNVYDLGSAAFRWRDLYLSGQSIDIDGVRISKDYVKNTIKITNADGQPTDTDVGTLTSSNALVIGGSLGIGTTTPVAAVTVQTGNAVVLGGNIGIGTALPQEALHVKTRALIEGHVGIGTVVSSSEVLDVGGRTRVQGEMSAQGLRLNEWTDGMIVASNVIYGPITATNKWLVGSGGLAVRDAADALPLVFVDPVGGRVGFGTATGLHAKVEIFRNAASIANGGDDASLVLSHEVAEGKSSMILQRRGAAGGEYGFVEYTDSNQTLAIGVSQTASNVTITGRTAIESRAAKHSVLGGNLGIGTQEPRATLDVRGKSYFQDTVGIGTFGVTNATSAPLHVHGGLFLNVSDFAADSGARFYASAPKKVAVDVDFGAGPETQVLTVPHTAVDAQYVGTDVDLQFLTGRPLAPRISVMYNGNVGVGSAIPSAPLDVAGNAVFRSMVSGDSSAGFARLGVNVSASNVAAGQVLDVRGSAQFIPANSNYSLNWSDAGLVVSGPVSLQDVTRLNGALINGTTQASGVMFDIGTEDVQMGVGTAKLFVSRSNIQVGTFKRYDVTVNSVDVDTHVQLRKSVFIGGTPRTPTVANADFIVDHSAAFTNQVVFSSNTFYSAGSTSRLRFGTVAQPRHEIYSPTAIAIELRTASLDTTGFQTWFTNGQERMRVAADGNIGIGTNAPAARLHIGGGGGVVGGDLRVDSNISALRLSTSRGVYFENGNSGAGTDGQPALRLSAESGSGEAAWGVRYLPSDQVGAGVRQAAPLQIHASALVGYTAAGENWGTNNLFVGGNVGIGTTAVALSGAIFQAQGNVQFGNGLKTDGNQNDGYLGGPFFKQQSWGAVGATRTIAYPLYCQGQNASGTLHVQVKSYLNNKLANLHISYLTTGADAVDVFVLSHHRTPNMTTLNAYASGGDIVVETDADCAIAWTSIGAI